MRNQITFFVLIGFLQLSTALAQSVQATEIPDLVSAFCPTAKIPSTQQILSLPNAHFVDGANQNNQMVLRGNGPYLPVQIQELNQLDVGLVVVFKNFKNNNQYQELIDLYSNNDYKGKIVYFPFPWKNQGSASYDTVGACKMAIQAVKLISASDKNVFFHCTVGEDRTGMLAGLLKLYNRNQIVKDDVLKVFKTEMCARGYSSGNPNKPEFVSRIVDKNLTPLYLQLATLISQKNLEEAECESLPQKLIGDLKAEELFCEPAESAKLCLKD